MRLLVSASLILAWAMPALTATVVWQWIFDTQYGLVNWALDRQGERWLAEPADLLHGGHDHRRVDGHPVRRLHLYAAPDPDPRRRSIEAAKLDGAGFRDSASATSSFPALKPILLILTSLSVLWDFRVFTQIYVLQQAGGITRDTNLLGVYAYRISIGENHFDIGAAVAVVMVVITVAADRRLPAVDGPTGGAGVTIAPRHRRRYERVGLNAARRRRRRRSPCSPCTGWC